MTRSLSTKLALAFVAVTLTGIVIFALVAARATQARFDEFRFTSEQARLIAGLESYYESQGSWAGIGRLLAAQRPEGGGAPGAGRGAGRGGETNFAALVLVDENGRVIVPGFGFERGEQVHPDERTVSMPIVVDGQQVGAVYTRPNELAPGPMEQAFLSGVSRTLIQSAVIASILALVLGIVLARTLTGPLRELTLATRALAGGDLSQEVKVHSQDELGELAGAFNLMSSELSSAVEQRKQMTADIAHDLRTPLSIILGYTESLNDGILQPTPEALAIIHDEARHLSRLVEDLRTLSLADAGELNLMRQQVDVPELLNRVALAHKRQALEGQVRLVVESANGLPPANVDPDRMEQVLRNLLSNAIRHTPAGGQVTLSAVQEKGALILAVQDSGSGISPEHLPHVFDRFYRGDSARQDSEDSSGLGLAITRSLVRLHGGDVRVYSEPGAGARFEITLPSDGSSLKGAGIDQ